MPNLHEILRPHFCRVAADALPGLLTLRARSPGKRSAAGQLLKNARCQQLPDGMGRVDGTHSTAPGNAKKARGVSGQQAQYRD